MPLCVYRILAIALFWTLLSVGMQEEHKIKQWEEGKSDPYVQAIEELDVDRVASLLAGGVPLTSRGANYYIQRHSMMERFQKSDNILRGREVGELDGAVGKLDAIGERIKTLYLKKGRQKPSDMSEIDWTKFKECAYPFEFLDTIITKNAPQKGHQEKQDQDQRALEEKFDELMRKTDALLKQHQEIEGKK